MPFKKFVETGRVAYITKGKYGRRLCSIVDVVDQNRALIDGPCTGVPRMAIKLKQLRLTKFVIKFPYRASTKVVRKVWNDSKIKDKWASSQWAQNIQRKRLRRQLNDYDRFKLRYARSIRNKIRTKEYIKLYREDKKIRGKLKSENRGTRKAYNRRSRKKGESKKVAPKKLIATKVTKKKAPKKVVTKKEAPKKESIKKDAPKKDAPKKDAPKKDAPKKDAPKKEAPKKEAPKKETVKKEAPKKVTPKKATTPAPKK